MCSEYNIGINEALIGVVLWKVPLKVVESVGLQQPDLVSSLQNP
jgi:hypothetical protein